MGGRFFDQAVRSIIPRELRSESLPETIRFLESFPHHADEDGVLCESPIFILSAGWRSGSTLLQRLVCSSTNTLIWGEPFGDRIPVCRLAATLQGLGDGDPHLKYSVDHFEGDLSRAWIANLNPGMAAVRRAHLSYFERMFAETAASRQAHRWGVKWVRLTGYHAWYLKWLYPKARLLFLVRHPLEAYRSYKRKRWYTVKPHYKVNSAARFMAHWSYLAQSFLRETDKLGALLVRYEDLIQGHEAAERLESYLDAPLERSVLSHRVGARRKEHLKIRWWERAICTFLTNGARNALGYKASE